MPIGGCCGGCWNEFITGLLSAGPGVGAGASANTDANGFEGSAAGGAAPGGKAAATSTANWSNGLLMVVVRDDNLDEQYTVYRPFDSFFSLLISSKQFRQNYNTVQWFVAELEYSYPCQYVFVASVTSN